MFLTPADLAPFAQIEQAQAEAMIADAEAQAKQAAPCLATATLTPDQSAFVRSVLRGVVLRWHDRGTGALQSETIGNVSVTMDTRTTTSRSLFWPSELAQLRNLCATISGTAKTGAFTIDTTPPVAKPSPWVTI